MRQSGKYGKILLAKTVTVATAELATLNVAPVTIGGIVYAIAQVATLAFKRVLYDSPDTPVTIVLAVGTGSAIPSDIDYIIDYVNGRILFDAALTAGNTVTVTYSYAASPAVVVDVEEWDLDLKLKTLEVSAQNDDNEWYIPLQKSWDGTLTGFLNLVVFDAMQGDPSSGDADAAGAAISGKHVYLELFVNRRSALSATNPKFVGQALLTSYPVKAPKDGKMEIAVKFQGCGPLIRQIA